MTFRAGARRPALAAALAAVLTAGLAGACGSDAEETRLSSASTALTPTTAAAAPSTVPSAVPSTSAAAPSTTTAAPTTVAGNVIAVTVAGGKVEGGGRKQVKKDERVTIRVTSDVADEVHLHGYDQSVEVAAGGVAELEFVADRTGVWEVELEKKRLPLLQLEVR
ncbi:MAG: hypothetical protein ACKVWR_10080 [Acidimicrobiales bacterium]